VLESVASPSGEVRLPVPDCLRESSFDAKRAKEFLVGLLENPVHHAWTGPLARCPASVRMSVAGTLFLFRKCLPSPGESLISSHRARLCTDPKPLDLPSGYLAHSRRIARMCFPPGWDRGYPDAVWRSTPSVSACLERKKGEGGARATRPDRAQFLLDCSREGRDIDIPRDVRFHVVSENGKDRGVTIASCKQRVLHPLHKTIYGHLSRLPWLLRGEAKPSKFTDFKPVPGEVFVSGDYEAASDYLPLPVAEALLDVMASTSSFIPSTLWAAARRSLRSRIWYEDCTIPFEQVCGQLMGNLLCFPLLCLQNYVAFRWIFPASVPVKINGDDIVFRCTEEKWLEWSRFVPRVGLRLSLGKTLVLRRYFSLNSTFFFSGRSGARCVPVLRTGGLVKPVDSVDSLGSALRSFVRGFSGRSRELAEGFFLRLRKKWIVSSGRSVLRGLRIPVSVPALQASGLWRRECWFFDTLGSENRLPAAPRKLDWGACPEGWERVPLARHWRARRRQRCVERSFYVELNALAWERPFTQSDSRRSYWSAVKGSGHQLAWVRWRRQLKLWPRLCHANSERYSRCFASNGPICPHLARMRVTDRKCRAFLESGERKERGVVWVPRDPLGVTRTQFVQ
jgi:hypothetical protein